MKIQLKINGAWAILPPHFSLKMIKNSPLFSEQGDFSYPFELLVEPNRHIFGPIADPMGFVRLRDFHALPAEIWFEGNQVFVGQTEVRGEQTFSKRGKVSFNVASNNRAFKYMISGLKCRDVKLKRELQLGVLPKKFVAVWGSAVWDHDWTTRFSKVDYEIVKDLPYISKIEEIEFAGEKVLQATFNKQMLGEIDIPDGVVICDKSKVNVDKPYSPDPSIGMDYCNVSVCCKRGGEIGSDNTGNGYAVYKYDRVNWAPCFYVLYFIECLFDEKNLGISYNFNELLQEEDLTRLAFLNAAPRYDHDGYYGWLSDYDVSQPSDDGIAGHFHKVLDVRANAFMKYPNLGYINKQGWTINGAPGHNPLAYITEYHVYGGTAIANSDNFPDNTDVQKVFDDLKNAFGVFMDYDQTNNHAEFRLVRDIMKGTEVEHPLCTILAEPAITRNLNNGQRIKYSASDEDEDVYDYKLEDDDVPEEVSLLELVSWQLSKTDKKTKYDRETANFYRIKVNEDTGNEPQIFEVGGYNKYQIGVLMKDEEREIEEEGVSEAIINFSPVTTNDVWMWYVNRTKESVDLWEYPDSKDDSMLAVWVDAESYYKIQDDDIFELNEYKEPVKVGNELFQVAESKITTLDFKKRMQLHLPDGTPWHKASFFTIDGEATCIVRGDCAYDMSQDNNPLALADVGYQLGIMRGPGNKAEEEYTYDYDDEGNDTWYSVPENPCFTADSIDQYGRVFDYNGLADDGAAIEGRLSLKLDARKVKEYDKDGNPIYFDCDNVLFARRGLVPQLLEDFLYFKAHHVKVTFPVLMSLSAINNLRLLKWNRFGDYVGLIKQVNYELTEDGLRNVTVELLVANK